MTELFPEPLRHELSRSQMDRILLWCVEKRASDIVFCPGDPVWMEQDGVWRRVTDAGLTPSETERIVNETTMQASRAGYVRSGRSTDYAYQTRVPESRGVWQRFRVNATSTSKGIYIVMRALPRAIPTLGGMEGISDSLRRALYPASGLVCVSGVMGSGNPPSSPPSSARASPGQQRGARSSRSRIPSSSTSRAWAPASVRRP